ncbi:MAG: hypothetical protein LBN10_08995 [Propionibacteriaceae bacterium]|jgi:hypothetical protein|nr:hypothetical protein [Propionibacteriaceae bacterium]
MGLLDSLLKGESTAGQFIGGLIDKAVDAAKEVEEFAKDKVDGAEETEGTAPVDSSGTPVSEPDKNAAFFATVLAEDFPQYQVRENVPVSEFGGDGKPYDFVLSLGGKTVGVISLVQHNRDRNKAYRNSRAAAQAAGVPFINFYLHMPNEREFVKYRISHNALAV